MVSMPRLLRRNKLLLLVDHSVYMIVCILCFKPNKHMKEKKEEVPGSLHLGITDRLGAPQHHHPGPLVHIHNQHPNRCFLVDTGASFSISSHHSSAAPSGLPALVLPGNSSHAGVKNPLCSLSMWAFSVDFFFTHCCFFPYCSGQKTPDYS
jgi:hypothetical protein